MASLAFELGFDWRVNAIQGVRDGVFPLQYALVNDDTSQVISPYNPSVIKTQDTLSFRVYNFSASISVVDPPVPTALQVLFSSATTDTNDPFTPITTAQGIPQAQLAAIKFSSQAVPPSIAFGVTTGWTVQLSNGTSDVTFIQLGRFNFRALLTLVAPGTMARFYRADPEMVIGDGGP